MFWIGYRFLMSVFQLAVNVKAAWDDKASKFLHGRIQVDKKLSDWIKQNDHSTIQIHCASLGEFELSLPIYHSLKAAYPSHKFLFTFFSPSGFEYAKIPKGEAKTYLPFDKRKMVKRFLDETKIEFVIFIKYEFWFEYLDELKQRNIPFGFVNINQQHITQNLKFRKAKDIINQAAFICTSNQRSTQILKAHDIKVTGQYSDLRYAQSLQIEKTPYDLDLEIKQWFDQRPTIICGSIWKDDLSVLLKPIEKYQNINWVMAPHEISDRMLKHLESSFEYVSYLSEDKASTDSNILIIDTIGDLKYLYKYGSLNYVGGAFKTGLHNVLEPLYAQSPIVFGPNYQAFPEAQYLIENQLGFSIKSSEEFDGIIEKMLNGSLHLETPKKLENIKQDLKQLTQVLLKSYESRN